MLEIINKLSPFIEDCYREISVREYARMTKISPPSASKILKSFEKEELLKKREDKGYLLFRSNRENHILKDISRIYWRIRLKSFIEYLDFELNSPTIILFGSLAKVEARNDSDIDIAIIGEIDSTKLNKLKFSEYEKELGREINPIISKKLNQIPKELMQNITNGYVLQGELK